MYHIDFLNDILYDLPKTQAGDYVTFMDDLFQIYFRQVQAVGGIAMQNIRVNLPTTTGAAATATLLFERDYTQGNHWLDLLHLIRHNVDIDLRLDLGNVNRGVQLPGLQRLDRRDDLQAAGCAQRVANR